MAGTRQRLTDLALGRGEPPPGPFRPTFWRSPLRGPWLTAVFGCALLVGIPVIFLTGLLSYASYDPGLGARNDQTPGKGLLGSYLFDWPTDPSWLYRAVIGVHVLLGVTILPLVLAKLWSVSPKLFSWPPVKTPAQIVERLSLVLLVGGAVFELMTGLMNIQIFYPWGFSFYTAHFYGAWVFIGAFVTHVAVKLPAMRTALRTRSIRRELRTGLADTVAEDDTESGLVAAAPAPATMSRRGLLGLVSAGSLLLLGLAGGQTISDKLRGTALLAPRGGSYPGDFPVNKTARSRGITAADVSDSWRLSVHAGERSMELSRAQLLAMPQTTARLPIACVEGWSTVQTWSGVRIADLLDLVGATPTTVEVTSMQTHGAFGVVRLAHNQVADHRSLLALSVNGAPLTLDHGFPARIIVPAAPGVHCTKWVQDVRVVERGA